MATSGSGVRRRRRALPMLPPEGSRESVIKQKFEIPEFDVERLHKLPPRILSQINAVENDNTLIRGKVRYFVCLCVCDTHHSIIINNIQPSLSYRLKTSKTQISQGKARRVKSP